MKKIVYIAIAFFASTACGGDGKSVQEKCEAAVDYAFSSCDGDKSDTIAMAKAVCANIPEDCAAAASAAYDCMVTATHVCTDPPGFPITTECDDETKAMGNCFSGPRNTPDGGANSDGGTSSDAGTSGDLGTATTNFLET